MLNKKQLSYVAELLDERYTIAVQTDARKGNADSNAFLPDNADYVYYQAMLDLLQAMGIDWQRNNGKHKLFK